MHPIDNPIRTHQRRPLLFAGLLACAALALPVLASAAGEEDVFVPGEALYLSSPLDTSSFLVGGYAIDSSGYAELPVVGRIPVGGRHRKEIEDLLIGSLSNYLKDTHILAVPSIRLTMLGYFGRQGQYYLSPNATVWEAVKKAGGLGGDRNLDKLKLMRGNSDVDISLLDAYSKGMTLAAAGIHSGDIFLIPVPRDNVGAWYWFKEGLSATAQIATVVGTVMTAYITYTLIQRQ
jgi:protein involved in polysaccharide export with SLBB domain